MFQLTDVGTDISVPTSVIAAVIPFSLFTAYHFCVLTGFLIVLKAKCNHLHHVCADGLAPWWWKWSRRGFSLFTAYQILSADFYFQGALHTAITDAVYCVKLVAYDRRVANKLRKGLDKALHKSYNTTPAEGGITSLCSCWLILSDHMFIISRYEFDHMCWLACSFSVLDAFLLCRRSKFRAHLPPENKTTYQSFGTRIWPHLWP